VEPFVGSIPSVVGQECASTARRRTLQVIPGIVHEQGEVKFGPASRMGRARQEKRRKNSQNDESV